MPDPNEAKTFEGSRLDWSRRDGRHAQAALERTQGLLRLRAERIVPMLAGTDANAGARLDTERDAIAVDWRLNGGLLQLRANFAHHPVRMPPIEGETIHLTGATMGAPNSTLFAIASA